MSEPLVRVRLQPDPIDVEALRRNRPVTGECGGYVAFEGVVRHHNEGRTVLKLFYEAYQSLALKELSRIASHAAAEHGVRFVEVVHRLGELQVGEVAVVVHVYSHHRQEAFLACMDVIDQLKKTAPIWKKEFYADGSTAWPRCHDQH